MRFRTLAFWILIGCIALPTPSIAQETREKTRRSAERILKIGKTITLPKTKLACSRSCTLLLKGERAVVVDTNFPHTVCLRPVSYQNGVCYWTTIDTLLPEAP